MFAVPDAGADRRFAGNPLVTGAVSSVRFYAGAPLLHEGMPLGALCATDSRPHRVIDEGGRAALARLAAEASTILAGYRRPAVTPGPA